MSKKPDWQDRVERTLKDSLAVQRDILKALSNGGDTGQRTNGFGFKIGQPKLKPYTKMPLELTVTNEQEIDVTVTPKTDTGKPAKIDGKPSWTVLTGNSQVIVSEDGLTATLRSSDELGDTQVVVKADANLDPDPAAFEEISDIITLKVVGATAKNLGLAAGTARPKPEPTPA